MTPAFTDLDGLVDRIPDGATIALPPDHAGCAMALVRRMIQHGVRGLRLVGAPPPGLGADLLIGAGAAATGPAATRADVAVFHVGRVDRNGNVRAAHDCMAMARAAAAVVVTYEARVEEDLLAGEGFDTIPAHRVAALAEAVQGAWPLGLPGYYAPDRGHLQLYARCAASDGGFQRYLRNYVYQQLAAE